MDGTIEKIQILKSLGIKFSIDDFGTGYSSMTYLQKLPIDNIKIDRSFIMDLYSQSNQEIVKMIINFAKIFNLTIIAEGVENKYTLDFLKDNKCDIYQGYYFSRAIQVNEITQLLKEQK
jgi:EAL domain-containing protein (putative c-di-GMP-specific phosphodiesterase class I)